MHTAVDYAIRLFYGFNQNFIRKIKWKWVHAVIRCVCVSCYVWWLSSFINGERIELDFVKSCDTNTVNKRKLESSTCNHCINDRESNSRVDNIKISISFKFMVAFHFFAFLFRLFSLIIRQICAIHCDRNCFKWKSSSYGSFFS